MAGVASYGKVHYGKDCYGMARTGGAGKACSGMVLSGTAWLGVYCKKGGENDLRMENKLVQDGR